MTNRSHDINIHTDPTPDDEGNGVQAILRAFLRNPVAAVEVFMFIGGLYGVYYALNYKVDDAKASSEQHYKDLSAEMTHNNERVLAKMEVLANSDAQELMDIKGIYARGDQRYSGLMERLAAMDVRAARLEDSINYDTKLLEQKTFDGRERHTEIGPRPPMAAAR